jgi:hypothetical protein
MVQKELLHIGVKNKLLAQEVQLVALPVQELHKITHG